MVGGEINATWVIATVFFLIPYNLTMYGVNDVFDYQSDLKNPRKGGAQGALLAPRYHRGTLIAAAVISIPFLLYLVAVGSAISNLVLVTAMFAVLAYSLKGLRFKEIPFLDSLTSASHFTLPVIYGLSLADAEISIDLAIIVVSLFLWSMASHAFGAVQDINSDRDAGIASIATVIGARNTVWFAFLAYALAAISLVFASGTIPMAAIALIPYLLILTPYLKITDADSQRANSGWKAFLWLNIFAGAVVSLLIIEWLQS